MLHAYHKCCTNGTYNVFLWQSFRNRQIIWIKKVKSVLLKNKLKRKEVIFTIYFKLISMVTKVCNILFPYSWEGGLL